MSKKSYVTQQDRPNLVIVPTVTCYEPSPEKTRLENTSSSTKLPGNIQQASEKSALNNAGVKVMPRVSSVNKNVLVDVSKVKRQPNSWATNFLHSIGGSASKLPRAYNSQSSASKLAFLHNNNIQPKNYNTNTTQSNLNKETIGLKSIKELTPTKTDTNTSQPKPNNDFSLTIRTDVPTKTTIQCPQPTDNKEVHHSIDSKARFMPIVNKDSSHRKVSKKATSKAKKETSQPKFTKKVTGIKSKKELTHLTSDTKHDTQTKAIFKKRSHKEATKHRDKPETCQTKVHVTVSDTNLHKEKFKSKILKETEKKHSKTQTSLANSENISQKKKKVDGKKSRESSSDKNKKSKEINSKQIHRESSKSKKSISPIKSVVKKIKNHASDDPKFSNEYELNHNSHHLEKNSKDSDVDLRAKLKRKASRNDIPTKDNEINDKIKCKNIFPTMVKRKRFVPDENLIISFDTENDTEVVEKITPVKTKTRKHQSGGTKCKKIKLEINIVFQKDDTTDDETSKCGDIEDYENNTDLSFLDDFNVDEIAESLNDCQSNVVKIGNLINTEETKRTSKIDVDLTIPNDKNTTINNSECLSEGERIIENNTTNVSSLTLCNEKSIIKTENKAMGLINKVESLADSNSITENNNGTSELKNRNILETQREAGSGTVGTDKLSNAVGEVKTEFVTNHANNINENLICVACSKDLSATNSNNMKNLSEPVTLQRERQLKNENILTCTEIKSEEVCHNPTSLTQLDAKNSNKLQKENTETDKTTNIDSCKHVDNLDSDENVTQQSDLRNKGKTMSDTKHETTVTMKKVETVEPSIYVNNNKHQDEVILVEDSDNDYDDNMAEVQGGKNLPQDDIIDLTFQKDCSIDIKRKEVFTTDVLELETNETDSEPILILETDYDELKINDDLKNENEVMGSEKIPEPIDIIKKHLFCNSDKTHASDKILFLDHKGNSETKKSQYKSTETETLKTNTCQYKSNDVKLKNSPEKNITPSVEDKKYAAFKKGTVTHNIIPVDTKVAKAAQDQAQIETQIQKELNDSKKSATIGEQMSHIKENYDNKTKMQIVNNGDTKTRNTVIQNEAKTNAQDHKDAKLNVEIKSAITEKLLSHTKEDDDIMWLENKISQDMKEKKFFTEGQKGGKLNNKKKSACTRNSTSNSKENRDGHIRMWVVNKGDTRTHTVEQNQPKPEDTKDSNAKTVDNMNPQNVNAKSQTNEPKNTSAQAASNGNKNTPTPKPMVTGDPRIKQNQPKPNSQHTKDGKQKTTSTINSQNKNKCSPQAKGSSLYSRFVQKNLVEIDSFARRLECRMRVYFGAKYWVTDLIHNGRFSTIYLVKDPDGVSKAVKQIKESWQIGAHKEGIMMKLQNGIPERNYNCVRYEHGFTVDMQWCYVMEYYPKNLQEALNINNRSFHIDKVQEFSRQLVAAVTILRNNNIIHSDINTTHILINESETRIKLCGFDQAFYYNGGDLLPNVGTANYRAPELILGFHADYGIDVWATALVMYKMATNRQLFPGCFNNDIMYKQLCTLDIFPYEMLENCYYRNQYFMGNAFIRIVGTRGEGKVLIRDFFKKERIQSVLHQVYLTEWAKFGANRVQDKSKINALSKLLNKMLVMDPRSRIAIEFVFADPFIFETF